MWEIMQEVRPPSKMLDPRLLSKSGECAKEKKNMIETTSHVAASGLLPAGSCLEFCDVMHGSKCWNPEARM